MGKKASDRKESRGAYHRFAVGIFPRDFSSGPFGLSRTHFHDCVMHYFTTPITVNNLCGRRALHTRTYGKSLNE